jgi:SSS family solute:Na+ symporter
MNTLDYLVVFLVILGIAGYGVWRTRNLRNLDSYMKGAGNTPWFLIGLSVMATQASATTFISIPGQGFESGMKFVQNYFGAPFALIIISAFFLPIFTRLNIYSVYEFLGRRFDFKTRLLGVGLFLLQRGIGAGITIYAPAIVLSTVMGWPLHATIIASGLVVTVYTVIGGSDAVTHTQKFQIGVIFAGMATAFVILLRHMPEDISLGEALTVAGGFNRLQTVDFNTNLNERYTFWSGLLGGLFLALSYFGTDQSQVGRYTAGHSLRESRLGLMFNAVCKIPMQFFILLLGVLIFVFYQFERPPVFFNQVAWAREVEKDKGQSLRAYEEQYREVQGQKQVFIERWLEAQRRGDNAAAVEARGQALTAHATSETIRTKAKAALKEINPKIETKDSDYVFITFILNYLPHGVIGLLIAAFFAATMQSKAGELNALGAATTMDLYRPLHGDRAPEIHYLRASKWFTAGWGVLAICIAIFANLAAENLIEAGNILGSVFYGVPLALFLVGVFLRWIHGTAVFLSAVITQVLIIVFYFNLSISYLWYNLIGCLICVGLAFLLEAVLRTLGRGPRPAAA